MTVKPRPATRDQVDGLIGDARALPAQPVGDHLTDDQFVAYSMHPPELSIGTIGQIDAHLASCDECAGRMEHLLGVAQAWHGPAGESRLAAIAQQIRASLTVESIAAAASPGEAPVRARFGDWIRAVKWHAALVPTGSAPSEYASPFKLDFVSIADEEGDLHIAVSSHQLELAGTRIHVEPFRRSLTLRLVAPGEVGDEILIPRAERVGLAADTTGTLRVDTTQRS